MGAHRNGGSAVPFVHRIEGKQDPNRPCFGIGHERVVAITVPTHPRPDPRGLDRQIAEVKHELSCVDGKAFTDARPYQSAVDAGDESEIVTKQVSDDEGFSETHAAFDSGIPIRIARRDLGHGHSVSYDRRVSVLVSVDQLIRSMGQEFYDTIAQDARNKLEPAFGECHGSRRT
jgi:hypothetical protein